MLLAASEGRHFRYEVCEHEDGYLVQMRDLVTGDLDPVFSTIFRTVPVAFAFAEMSAAFERVAAAHLETPECGESERDLEATEQNFNDLRDRLQDCGVADAVAQAWDREREGQGTPYRRLH